MIVVKDIWAKWSGSKEAKHLWDKWNIRGVILFSLLLQTILIFFAPSRKRTARKFLILLIWTAYLLADWAANFTVGLISNSQNDSKKPDTSDETQKLLAFWAPFLLLHLGGPDTITAFALEDNELWLRHLLSLIFQTVAGVYVFLQSIPNKLWIPILLMFVTGLIKYVERTRALYLASLDKFRDSMLTEPDPGPNYAKLMEEYASKRDSQLPTQIIMIPEPDKELKAKAPVRKHELNRLQIVQYAYQYYKTSKGLIVDLIFSFHERDKSRDFFTKLSPLEALSIIEVELNFFYEALYTKAEVLHSKSGIMFRVLAFSTLVSSFGLFHYRVDKTKFEQIDVDITYALLVGAMMLDSIAIVMSILSDWTIAVLTELKEEPEVMKKNSIICWLLDLKKILWKSCICHNLGNFTGHEALATSCLFRRWSGSISLHNLIGYCLKTSPKRIHITKGWTSCLLETIVRWSGIGYLVKVINQFVSNIKPYFAFLNFIPRFYRSVVAYIVDLFGLTDLWDEIRYVSNEPLTRNLWEFIFNELHRKSKLADDPETTKKISAAKGEWILDNHSKTDFDTLMDYVVHVDYDQSILLWHIATELCYQTEEATADNFNDREISKILSDYMLYLLIMQPTMMSAVAGIGKIRFRDTCAEVDRFFKRRNIEKSKDEKSASKAILSVKTDVQPVAVKGDRSKSVLFDASMLCQELKRLEKEHGEEKWKILSKVWVEMLSYAASHCDAKTHAQQVSKGGQLITFVWLLMAHLGLGEQFKINEGHARAKLIIGK